MTNILKCPVPLSSITFFFLIKKNLFCAKVEIIAQKFVLSAYHFANKMPSWPLSAIKANKTSHTNDNIKCWAQLYPVWEMALIARIHWNQEIPGQLKPGTQNNLALVLRGRVSGEQSRSGTGHPGLCNHHPWRFSRFN